MLAIGEFARYSRVTVRMLRRYDAIGLLEPVCVDPASGYRFYEAGQLSSLNRIVALKNLGFTLRQVASILDEQLSPAELRGGAINVHAALPIAEPPVGSQEPIAPKQGPFSYSLNDKESQWTSCRQSRSGQTCPMWVSRPG